MIPIYDTAPRARPPAVVLALIAINSIVFVWMWTLSPRALEAVTYTYALVPLRYADPWGALQVGLDPHDWWPLLTNTFMHGGWLHLGLNMWMLWIFGPAMEARFGRIGFAVFYVGGGIAASMTHLVTNWTSDLPALGASGAIAAVLAAYSVCYPREQVLTIVPIGIIPLPIPAPAILFAIVWFAIQLLQGWSELLAPSIAGGVAWWAHIGGFVFGALVAWPFRTRGWSAHVATTQWHPKPTSVPPVPRGPWARFE